MKIHKPSLVSLRKILKRLDKATVVVAGDIILDCYIIGKARRISPEAPVPVVEVEETYYKLGGAANVAANVAALGATAKLVGLIGDDYYGKDMLKLIADGGIDIAGIDTDPGRPTTLKTRVIAANQYNQQVVRFDKEVIDPPEKRTAARMLKLFAESIGDAQIAILSDYDKGLFRAGLASSAIKIASARGVKIAVDPKVRNIDRFKGAFVITPNEREAGDIVGFAVETDKDVERAGATLSRKLNCPNVLITRGKMGMSLYRKSTPIENVPTIARQVFDVTGAGDTAIAVLSAAVAAGASMPEAMWIANAAAGVTVSKIGAATVSVSEIEDQLAEEYKKL